MTQAEQLNEEGLALFQKGRRQEAVKVFETAVQAFNTNGNKIGQAEALNNIGVIQRLLGNKEAALQALTDAEQLFGEVGEANKQAQALGNLGDIHAANRQVDEAARFYSRTSALFAQTGDGAKQSQVLRALSLLQLKRGRWFVAMSHMEESLRVNPRPTIGQRIFRAMLRFVVGSSAS